MAWTLNLLLIVGAVALVTYLHRTIQKIRRNAFVYPSEAFIDQVLPPEIMEQIFYNLDYGSITACSEVSKYWRHHAIKEQIQDFIVRNDTSLQANLDKLQRIINERKKPYDVVKLKPHSYPDNYPIKWRLEDQLFAKKLGKELIETDLINARHLFGEVLECIQSFGYDPDSPGHNYLTKIRGELEFKSINEWNIKDSSGATYRIDLSYITDPSDGFKYSQKYTFTARLECEVIVNFSKLKGKTAYSLTNAVEKMRLLDNRPQVAGIPLNRKILQLAFLILLPCLIVDYRTSPESEAKFYTSVIVHAVFELMAVLIAVASQVPHNQDHEPLLKRKWKIGTILVMALLVIGGIFYRWSLELTNYSYMLGFCMLYYFLWQDFATNVYKHTKLILFITICMVVSMNDWKLTVDAVKSLEIFWTLLYNIFMHAQLGALMALHNLMMKYFREPNGVVSWRDLFTWTKPQREIYFIAMVPLAFITIYAPTTRTKIF